MKKYCKLYTVNSKLKAMFKKDYMVGLDIGSSSIKLAQFLKAPEGLRLVRADLKEIGYTNDEAVREKELQALLKKIVSKIDVKNSHFIVTVDCARTAIKKVAAPYMPKGELRDAIRLAAKNYFPFSIDEALIDFQIMGEVIDKGVKKYQVMVATSPKKTVNKYLSLLAGIGVKPAAFIAIPYAIQRLAQVLYSQEKGAMCFLDIGMYHTELVIFKGRDLVFSRKIPTAGNDVTKEMTGVLVSDRGRTGLSLEEAERIKREVGIPGEGKSEMIEDRISVAQILSMIRSPLEQLVSEIDRCFDYYREESDGGKIESLVLLGGGSSLKGLKDFLSNELGIEVRIENPLGGLNIQSGAIDGSFSATHRLSVAIGAGLSNAAGMNLLPPEIKEETKRTFKRATVQAVAVGVILTLALFYVGMRIQYASFQKRTAAAGMELSSLEPQMQQVEAQNLANRILQDEPYWEDVFKELSNIAPGNIHLKGFSMKDGVIKMRGVAASSAPEEILSNLILGLEKGIFNNVRLIGTKEIRGKVGNEFELECGFD
ncbi:MAG: type IV pilus assembly protein PilM [Candidatus Omnitrophica bacterium]|nr:type IV pilus assembly protein PilM [Candidatus Omnitrophota bacterium]